ncbi:DUF3298 and DUF4163 domain-containing protein [Mucilaginibacter segetis]|uniref:DUF3298 domain-containing protein n=1 Tax=Mucilaginibacter segetis TaxID=2793071 RepID=A0A934PXW0_9SPHI|nr:DUF3298 and DUF4163 domain-containing protein [Mucilaginibacter segetis]MBK0381086.1 DUF3298 domain-containing protein [Mucilaginibacter segetis]
MKARYFVLGSIIISMSACTWGKPDKKTDAIFTDTLIYQYQTIHERAADCGNKPDSTCTVASIKYPLFANDAVLNDTVKNKLLNMFSFYEKQPDSSLKEMSAKFLKTYNDFKNQHPELNMYYTLDDYVNIIKQDSGIVALEYGGYTFQGGAHGATFTGYINWNPVAHKPITLDDILVSGYRDSLTKVAEEIFRKDEKLPDGRGYERDYFFKDDKFALNKNYSIVPTGIKFVYNQYEIKPYAAGQTELLIPYNKIRSLIRPDAVIQQYLTKDAGI